MPLTAGTRLASYEITATLGAGGMGEVYRAKDLKLGRAVAIKVLPEAFAHDPDRIARFQREASVLASLNHPNIAALYGMEESAPSTTSTSSGEAGSGQAVHFLIMELVEGQTIAERLKRGPMGVDEALNVAHQIVDALEAAHEKTVVHRDLKPANVKITPEEKVKVLDFGLAKALEPAVANAQLTNSPTLSLMPTRAGMILGTAAYMSPEQAEGNQADHRSDLFSFGSVLYELLTSRRVFQGESAAGVLASVIAKEPDYAALPPNLNPRLGELLRRCLEKNPKRRWQAAGDLKMEIEAIQTAPRIGPSTTFGVAPPQPLWKRFVVFGGPSLLAGAAIAAGATWLAVRPAAPPPNVSRLTMPASGQAALTIGGDDRDLAITPDGTRVVYVGNNGTQLFVRALDALEPVAIATGQPRGPFISPDGQWVAFFDGTTALKKVPITGGPAISLAIVDGILPRGAVWAPGDTIIFATNNPATGLQRLSAAGGMPDTLTELDRARGDFDHLWPELLPGGRAVLFTINKTGGPDAAEVAVLDLQSNAQTILARGASHAQYVGSGHLVYTAAGTLRAIPFDVTRLEVRGPVVPVVPRLVTTPSGAGDFAVAANGTLVYVDAAGASAEARTLVWVDRMGKEEPLGAPPRAYVQPHFSPDGTRLALGIADQERDIWVWDLQRQTLTRLTVDPSNDAYPVWTLNGQRIVFGSTRSGALNLWWQRADGTGTAERLTTSRDAHAPSGIAPDGASVVFTEATGAANRNLMRVALDGARRMTPLLQTQFNEQSGKVSPDARWLVYESDSSGRFEIYVQPFPDGASRLVSTAGGSRAVWARSGNELFYLGADGSLMRVPVEASATGWNSGAPMKLFDMRGRYFTFVTSGQTYDVSPDGRRFVMIRQASADPAASPPTVIVVQHFDEELKARVPAR